MDPTEHEVEALMNLGLSREEAEGTLGGFNPCLSRAEALGDAPRCGECGEPYEDECWCEFENEDEDEDGDGEEDDEDFN